MQIKTESYLERIAYLRHVAAEDNYCVRADSESDFWRFVRSAPGIRRGNLVLVDNGNLRAVWKARDGSHLGLQFLGRGMLQYVIFRKREGADEMSRVAGTDCIQGVKRQIDDFGLASLLRE